jgi:F-type H+-transporting ATPase subunit alpha
MNERRRECQGERQGQPPELTARLQRLLGGLARGREEMPPLLPLPTEIGTVSRVGQGVVGLTGLPRVGLEELVTFERGGFGLALNLEPEQVGAVVLTGADIRAGDEVRRTGRVVDVPVGAGLIGRVVDPLGQPLDGLGPVLAATRWPAERPAPPIMHRAPVAAPLQTGLKVVDALVPIGRGQRQLILGDRQTGKSAVALDTIINQAGTGVLAVYCSIGQSSAAVARTVASLRERGSMAHTVVVVAAGDKPAGLQYIAPYAATSVAEYLMAEGRDVLIVYDDLTRHARAYRELSLLLRRPPGREAFPGDIFYIHSRLLERSTRMRPEHGGGSLTALPIVETEAQNMAAYIPTNIISITDGQIYLSPDLYRQGVLPAVDVGRSVSRVGGKAQLPAFSRVAGTLRLTYSQFTELEAFARFGTRLDPETRRRLERGYRVREALKQPQYGPVPVVEQIAVLAAVNEGMLDDVPLDRIGEAEAVVRKAFVERLPGLADRVRQGARLSDEDRQSMRDVMGAALAAADLRSTGGPKRDG